MALSLLSLLMKNSSRSSQFSISISLLISSYNFSSEAFSLWQGINMKTNFFIALIEYTDVKIRNNFLLSKFLCIFARCLFGIFYFVKLS